MLLGSSRILYIKDTTWKAIGCETSNSLSESISLFNSTQSSTTNGWTSFRTGAVEYSISFDGIIDSTSSFNYFDLVALKRARTKIEWKIESADDVYRQTGFGYFSDISESSPVDGYVSFSGNITGYGSITSEEITP
jgi:predicted secreted protein